MLTGSHLERLGGKVSTKLPKDRDGYFDRECPACERVFKVMPGTGLTDTSHCICPYCGAREAPDHFFTKEQMRYARDVTVGKVREAVRNDLEDMTRRFRSGGLTMRLERGYTPTPSYRHVALVGEITCPHCTCQYKVDGESGLCPDCGEMNPAKAGD